MKVFISSLAILLLLAGGEVAAGQFPDVKIRKINDRVYALLGDTGVPNRVNGGYVTNVLVVIGSKGVILVDAGSHKAVARHISAALAGITRKPVTHVFITHHHADHHLGVSAFRGAEVIGSDYCARRIEKRGDRVVGYMERVTGMKLGDDTVTVPRTRIPPNTRREMIVQDIRLEAITPGTAHTEGDLMLWLPDDKVLASGDILVHDVNPNFAEGHVKTWIGIVDNIRKLPFAVVMPGHGDLMRPPDVAAFATLLTGFYGTVLELYKAGRHEWDVRKTMDLEPWKRMSRFDSLMGPNINKLWLEVESDNF